MENIKQNYNDHWEEKFQSRTWGSYPSEDLVRFICGNFIKTQQKKSKVLEIGCGTGANLWFLQKEGLIISGIDASPTGISIAQKRVSLDAKAKNNSELKVGDFSTLPWENSKFDLVVDIFALYANTQKKISDTLSEVKRVLKPGGYFFTKLWGPRTLGYGTGTRVEHGTYTDIESGPCASMGVAHFFTTEEINLYFKEFTKMKFDEVLRYQDNKLIAQEFICIFQNK